MEEILSKCNITFDEYIHNYKWTGEGIETFCSDPAKLNKNILGNIPILYNKINDLTKSYPT